jgi:lipopolysaccharide biosynthesis regulator YciM
MASYATLLAALLALLFGLAAGKAWERYKLVDGRIVDRRRGRESPHYLLGLNFLVSNQIDLAIDELTKAAALYGDALEVQVMLGNLYREKGQVGRAISIHQTLLQRPKLRKLEQAHVLLCLGLDFKRGGFVDRALEAFKEVVRLEPNNPHALANLEKLQADQHQWLEAYNIRRSLVAASDAAEKPRHEAILAFLENELGREALKASDEAAAAARFQAAIDLDAHVMPAYLNLGDVYRTQGRLADAIALWERAIDIMPERAYLAFERLETVYAHSGGPERFARLCRRLIDANPQDWRARLALSRHQSAKRQSEEALELLFEALTQNPHALMVHQAIWQVLSQLNFSRARVERYMELTRHAVFYLDPHVCVYCRYRADELLWQCPHCHEWNTFVEDRIAPAKEEHEINA